MELAFALTELASAHSVMTTVPSDDKDLRCAEELFMEPRAQSTARRTKSSRHGQDNHTAEAAGVSESDDDDGEESECPRVTTKRQRRRQRNREKQRGSSSSSATTTDRALTRSEAKQERTRQLQNLRQRRYRARKKCSLSELQQRSQRLASDNARLERAIRAMLSLQ